MDSRAAARRTGRVRWTLLPGLSGGMNFDHSPKTLALLARLRAFMDEHIYPNETRYHEQLGSERWTRIPLLDELSQHARAAGLWNLFLPPAAGRDGLTNVEYAPLCEAMGRVHWSSQVFNCSAPDTGNMETLAHFGTPAQQRQWLEPLLDGRIRSAFAMTEPAVASSDATNIEASIQRSGSEYVINGRKWWISGAGDDRCQIFIFMGRSNPEAPRHRQQSMVLVPRDTPGVRIERPLTVFGYDDAPHGHMEIVFEDVRVPVDNVLLGEGRGFEIAQARLGPGRIHHCMRNIGVAERLLERICKRLSSRVAFGKPIAEQSIWLERIANCRIMIDQARLLVLNAADKMDRLGNKAARREIAMIKVAAPAMLNFVVDWAIQAHGAAGVTTDFGLGHIAASARTMRIVDGPDEVHRNQIGRMELERYR